MRTRCIWLLALTAVALASGTPGAVDTNFGTDGLVLIDSGGGALMALAAQDDGKIVTAGHDFDTASGRAQWRIRRHNADGSVDTGFGGDGDGELFGQHATNDLARDVTLDASDRIVVVGSATVEVQTTKGNKTTVTTKTGPTVVRLTPNGSLDGGFGASGRVLIDIGGIAEAVAIQPDGKILVAGTTALRVRGSQQTSAIFVARLTTGGSLDTGFGSGGVAIRNVNSGGLGDESAYPHALAVDGSGRIYVGARPMIVLRLTSAGAHDGTVVESNDLLRGLAVDGNDRLVVAGARVTATGSDALVARYDADGNPDTSFGDGGETMAGLAESNEAIGLALQADGGIVVGINLYPDSSGWLAVRFDADGTLDGGYGTGGVSGLVASDRTLAGIDVALDASGDLVIGGWTSAPIEWAMAKICGG